MNRSIEIGMLVVLLLSAGCSGRDETPTSDNGAPQRGDASALVGVWSVELLGGELPKWWPTEIELCGDGTMRDRDDGCVLVLLSWKADTGKLMFAAVYEGEVEGDFNMPEKVSVTFDYALAGSTLTLSNMVLSATVSGREIRRSGASVTYTKAPDTQRPRITVDRNPAIHLQCVNLDCGAILVKRYYDFTPEDRHKLAIPASPLRDAQDGWSPRLRCETCHDIMGRMILCTNPDCLKWFLDPSERDEAADEKRCPHCNFLQLR